MNPQKLIFQRSLLENKAKQNKTKQKENKRKIKNIAYIASNILAILGQYHFHCKY